MARYYDWDATFSRQTGSQGEFCIVAGAKNIGKTFGLRLKCIEEFLKKGYRFVEICRTKSERDEVMNGYYEKIQHDGFFKDYLFKCEKNCGYIARKPANEDDAPEWELITFFVALTNFQTEKRRTFTGMKRFIFDEAAIDRQKDRFHNYLPNEFFTLANILDSVTREQPGSKPFFKVYLLMNAVDLTCPYLRNLGVDRVPRFGYSFYNNKSTMLHYVEPWDADLRRETTLVGRMLAGSEESKMVFDNEFSTGHDGDVERKSAAAQYAFTIVFESSKYAVWIDYKQALFYITDKAPKHAKNIFALTKRDNTIDYLALRRTDKFLKMLVDVYYAGGLRYSSPALREMFLAVLGFLGVH